MSKKCPVLSLVLHLHHEVCWCCEFWKQFLMHCDPRPKEAVHRHIHIDLSHNCARDPKKNRANASVGQKVWREPRISSLFVWRNRRWRPCRLRFSGCSCAGLPIFQLRMANMSGQSWTSIFFVRFVSRAEIFAFFVGKAWIPNSSPVRSGTFILRH